MQQFRRKVRVTFAGGFVVNPGGFNKHDMMVSFDITKDLSSSSNEGTVEIYNLTESHRNALGKELDLIQIEAGHMPPQGGDNVGIIGMGDIRDVAHKRNGPDIITTVSFGEGDKSAGKASINKSYPAGTKVETVAEDAFKEMEKQGVKRGEWKFPDGIKPFKRPYVACGSCHRELNTLGRGKGFYWSIQNGAMEIIPSDGFIGMVPLLNAQTGLIDLSITDNGVDVSALLNPEIRPGRRVKIESTIQDLNATDGIYRVSSARFKGDNRTGGFTVDFAGEAVQGGKVDEGKK